MTTVSTGNETVSINIVSRSATQVYPEAFTFDATLSGFDSGAPTGSEIYDDRWHDIYYYWSFGDAYTFSAPTNVASAHKDANVSYGPMASHTFRAAGTYTVSLTVIEPLSGKTATTTLNVIVGNADALFSGAATLFVDPDSNFSGKPAGAAEYSDFSAAVAAAVAAGPSSPRRIMLRRGQTFPVTGQIWPIAPPSLQIVAQSGAGADPIIDWTPNEGNSLFYLQSIDDRDDPNPAKSIVFQNIDMRGDADVTAGTVTNSTFFFNFGTYPPRDFLLDRCTLSDVALAIYDRGSFGGVNVQGGECRKVINDCVFTGWVASAVFEGDNSVTVLTGSRFVQNPDAIADFDGTASSIIAPYRGGKNDRVIVDACDFFCNTGWSGTPSGTYKAIQPGLRFNSAANPGAKLTMQRCSVEAGFEVVSLGDANGEDAVAVNAVIERNILLSNFQGWWFFDASYGGITIRNNLLIHPNVRDASGRDPAYVMRLDYAGSNSVAYNAPIKIYNNTLVNLLAGSSYMNAEVPMIWISNPSAFANVVVENNVDHQPNLTTPLVASAPLNGSMNLFTPRYNGYASAANPAKDATLATPANSVATYAPLTGSPALGAALLEPTAHDDFYGQQRPQYPSLGAFEQSS